jgi:hypothetical protein
VKLINWVLEKFKESQLCLNQSLKILNTMVILLLKSVGFEWDKKMLVSSANRIGTDLSLTLFIKMLKSKGPKTEPWETPGSILAQVDVVILSFSLFSNVL